MAITLRHVTVADLPLLQELSILTCKDTFDPFNKPENMIAYMEEAFDMRQLEKELGEEGAVSYFACDGESVIGFMRLRESSETEKLLGTNTLELQRLYVLPEHKGKRAGSVMMTEAIRLAQSQSREWLWLGVWERNFPAQKFYAKWGFERFSEHTFVMGDDPQVDWLLKKAI